jgi:hypothetical protein
MKTKKMSVFWVVEPYSLIEVYRVSEVLALSIIRAIRRRENLRSHLGMKTAEDE